MLDYSKFYNILGLDYESRHEAEAQYVLDEINKRQDFLKTKKEQIDQLNYEADLITRDICNVIREDVWSQSKYNMFCGMTDEMLWEAWRYFNNCDDEKFEDYKDENTKENEKNSLCYVDVTIRRHIFTDKDEAKLTECLMYCYGIGYDFVYSYKGETIQVYVPLFRKTDFNNYLDMLVGYRLAYKESECSWQWIASSLVYTELKDKLDAWLKTRKSKALKEEKQHD